MTNINVRESQSDNQEWTIQRHRQHWAQDTERIQIKSDNLTLYYTFGEQLV